MTLAALESNQTRTNAIVGVYWVSSFSKNLDFDVWMTISKFWSKLIVQCPKFKILGMVGVRGVLETYSCCYWVNMIDQSSIMNLCQNYTKLSKFQKLNMLSKELRFEGMVRLKRLLIVHWFWFRLILMFLSLLVSFAQNSPMVE